MTTIGGALKIRPGCHAEYKRRHDELWPELAQAMREREISMVIYRFEDWVFFHATAPSQAAWAGLEGMPVSARWEKYIADVVEPDSSGKAECRVLTRIFAFGNYESRD